MSTYKRYIPILLVLVIAVSIFAYIRYPGASHEPLRTPTTSSTTQFVASTSRGSKAFVVPSSAETTTTSAATATLKVASTTYALSVRAGETVLGAMRALGSAGTLRFTGREYPGLGFFVDSINGVSSAGGKYWVFYVNGVSATQGISSTIIEKGDLVEWRYEKSY